MADLDLRDPGGGLNLSAGVAPHELSGVGNIASSAAFGLADLHLQLSLISIDSVAALGSIDLHVRIEPTGIASTAEVGTPMVVPYATPHTLSGVGNIASGAALGSPDLRLQLSPVSIGSTVALGSPDLRLQLLSVSIGSVAALGSPALRLQLSLSGLPSSAEVGVPQVIPESDAHQISGVGGIVSTAAVGMPALILPQYEPFKATSYVIGQLDVQSELLHLFTDVAALMGGIARDITLTALIDSLSTLKYKETAVAECKGLVEERSVLYE